MTAINYLDKTWNPVTGCHGKGCKVKDHCWAKGMADRFPAVHLGPFDIVQFHHGRLDQPLHWKKPRRIGVCFTGDLFDDQVPISWQHEIYKIVRQCSQHQFFILTKQAENMLERLENGSPLDNVYHGVSITDQEDADRMLPDLLKIQGKHWVSWEPGLGPFDFAGDDGNQPWYAFENEEGTITPGIDWVVIGCESGPKRRPMPLEWVEDVIRQCREAEVPIWVKQVAIGGKVVHDINQFPGWIRARREWPE